MLVDLALVLTVIVAITTGIESKCESKGYQGGRNPNYVQEQVDKSYLPWSKETNKEVHRYSSYALECLMGIHLLQHRKQISSYIKSLRKRNSTN